MIKKRGTHTSLIDGSNLIVNILKKNFFEYAPGIIKTSLSNTNKYLQIIENKDKKIKLVIRDSISLQEIKLFKTAVSGEEIEQIFLKDRKIQKMLKKGYRVFLKKL